MFQDAPWPAPSHFMGPGNHRRYSLLQLGASGSVSPAGPTMGPNAQSAAGKAPSSDGGIRRPLLPVTDTKAAVLAASGCCSSDNAVVLDQLDSER